MDDQDPTSEPDLAASVACVALTIAVLALAGLVVGHSWLLPVVVVGGALFLWGEAVRARG